MRKLKLEVDALRVETFETAAAEQGMGTVHGQARPTRQSCADTCEATCGDGSTCLETCVSCFGSCEPCATNPTTCPTGVPFCCIA